MSRTIDEKELRQSWRLSIEVTKEQHERLHRCIPYGMRNRVFGVLVDALCDQIETNQGDVIGAALNQKLWIQW